MKVKDSLYFLILAILFVIIGIVQSWSVSLSIFNLCVISAMMALGVNIQWGYAGLFSVGTVGFAALGGVAGVLVSKEPVEAAWQAGGAGVMLSLLVVICGTVSVLIIRRHMPANKKRTLLCSLIALVTYFIARSYFIEATESIESVNAASTGYLGGAGLPIVISWLIGGLLAAAIAWFIGKISLGLQSDYLAIATLGIGAITVSLFKNEDWLTRGVKNVTDLPRPVPTETDLVIQPWFIQLNSLLNAEINATASIFIKLCYAGLFVSVLAFIIYLSESALRSPWGRMMRAIRDNPDAAEAMGKDVTGRRLQAFVLGSAVIGVAGAMLVTLDGQFTPGSYQPLRYTFLIWVMVIVGGSGNNWGSVLGAFVIWLLWVEAETTGQFIVESLTSNMEDSNPIRQHLVNNAAHMRKVVMGVVLLLVMRFHPKGLIPERNYSSI